MGFQDCPAADAVALLLRKAAVVSAGQMRYRAAPQPGFLLIQYDGCVATVALARRNNAEFERMLLLHKLDQILWDSRYADPHPPEVRQLAWDWFCSSAVLRRSAILVASPMLRVSANMRALSDGVPVQSFQAYGEAAAWLRAEAVR